MKIEVAVRSFSTIVELGLAVGKNIAGHLVFEW